MYTVGEILKKARLKNKLTLEEVEKNIRIRRKFLEALENNSWDELPSLPYIKGFIKNYSKFLNLKPNEVIAIFRRQFAHQERTKLLPKETQAYSNSSFVRITPQRATFLVIISFAVVFFGYLFLQYKSSTSPPKLTVVSPKEGEVLSSGNVQIVGKTDSDAVISINNEKIALKNGRFKTTVMLPPGVNTITIESISKYGKKKTVTRTVQVVTE